jgi:hypothetical protein
MEYPANNCMTATLQHRTASKDISLTKQDAPFYNAKSTGCLKAQVALEKSQNENPSEIYLLGIPQNIAP